MDTQDLDAKTFALTNGKSITTMVRRKKELKTGIRRVILTNVYYTPAMKIYILSCLRLDEHGVSTKIQ